MKNEKIIVKIPNKVSEEVSKDKKLIEQHVSLVRRYNSLVEAIELVTKQNEIFRKEIEVGYAKLENAQKAVDINKSIVMNSLTEQNAMRVSYQAEINELKSKISQSKDVI